MDASHVLSVSTTPVVLVSACGLITLALYSRLGAILARIRAFHLQKIELLNKIHEHQSSEAQVLLEMLDAQIAEVTAKARSIQKSLYCLLSAIAAFLLCSLFAAVGVLHESGGIVAIFMYVLGLVQFLVGIVWAMKELSHSLMPLEEESDYLQTLTIHRLATASRPQTVRIAKSA